MKDIICKCGKTCAEFRTLESSTKGKLITLCFKCFDKYSNGLIKGHGYFEVLRHSKSQLLDHWCSYNGIDEENKNSY